MNLKEDMTHYLAMIQQCKDMIATINQQVNQMPGISELASEVIELEKELIVKFTNEIRSLRNV